MLEFINQNIWADYLLRLVASLICGFILGFERKLKQHTVGIRTLTLISVSSCLLSILSIKMADMGYVPGTGDPTRIAAGIITGIGFLGAGTIVTQGMNIRGLTSAAIIFTAAALGTACGAALYIPSFIVLFFCIITLITVSKLEKKFFPAEKRKILKLSFLNNSIDEKQIKKLISEKGLFIHDTDIKFSPNSKKTVISYTVKCPDNLDSLTLINSLSELKDVQNISLSKY